MRFEEFAKATGNSIEQVKKEICFIENEVENSAESGIMEMYRKGDTFRKTSDEGYKIIDKATYNKITKPAIKAGADIRIADDIIQERLIKAQATAVTYGDVIFFRKNPTVSDVLEEVHHFYQNKKGLNDKFSGKQRIILNEIEAKEYVISVKDKYLTPEGEIKLTKNQLEAYKNEMIEMKEAGDLID